MGEKLQFTELDQYLFGQGTHYEIYKKMGAHFVKDGKNIGILNRKEFEYLLSET